MDKETIEQIFGDILFNRINVTRSEYTEGTNLADDLGADSLDVIEIAMSVEDAFDFDILDTEIPGLRTVKDYINLISEKLSSKGTA